MTTIYLVRHAQSEGNLYRRFNCRYDAPLTELGQRQLSALRQRFHYVHVDHLYASPLRRALETAGAVADMTGLPIVEESGLLELDIGPWSNLPIGDVEAHWPDTLVKFRRCAPSFTLEGAETFQQVYDRMRDILLHLANEHDGEIVACVTHGYAIRAALCWARGWPSERMGELPIVENTSVTTLTIDKGVPTVVTEGSCEHLPEELSQVRRSRRHPERDPIGSIKLWFRDWQPESERELYLQFRQEAWRNVHGDEPFDGESFYAVALRASRYHSHSVRIAMNGTEIAGLIQLDLEREAEQGVGFIPFCYMCPPYRGNGLGVQLLGEAVAICRPLGRDKLRLRCSPDNHYAKRFYAANSFYYIGPALDSKVPLDLMEKRL